MSEEIENLSEDSSLPRLKNPDDIIGLCMDCGSPQRDRVMERQLMSGLSKLVCSYCGGVCDIVPRELAEYALQRNKTRRGIDNPDAQLKSG